MNLKKPKFWDYKTPNLSAYLLYPIAFFIETSKKLAKIKYLPNNFEILEEGDHVICALSGKKIPIENLNYWNVDDQEPYFSYIEASIKRDKNT